MAHITESGRIGLEEGHTSYKLMVSEQKLISTYNRTISYSKTQKGVINDYDYNTEGGH